MILLELATDLECKFFKDKIRDEKDRRFFLLLRTGELCMRSGARLGDRRSGEGGLSPVLKNEKIVSKLTYVHFKNHNIKNHNIKNSSKIVSKVTYVNIKKTVPL